MSNILTINFTTPKISEQVFRYCPSQPDEDPSAFPLQIITSPIKSRIKPNQIANLAHLQSGLKFSKPLTVEQAQQILKTTSYWDFSLDKDRKPRCSHELRSLIDSVVSGGDR